MKVLKTILANLALLVTAAAFSNVCIAQTASTGALTGTVTDPTRAVVTGAKVTATNQSTAYNFLLISINRFVPEITGGEKDLYSELLNEFNGYRSRLSQLLQSDLEALNQLLAREGLSQIVVQK